MLHGSDDTGYFLTSATVSAALGHLWKPGHDTEFKVNENTVADIARPDSYHSLIEKVLVFSVEQPS